VTQRLSMKTISNTAGAPPCNTTSDAGTGVVRPVYKRSSSSPPVTRSEDALIAEGTLLSRLHYQSSGCLQAFYLYNFTMY
jgi:hypothetical protein